jgi:hypothetical protein
MDLARALASADTLSTIAAATVVDLAADGTVTVDLGGGRVVPGCRVLATYSPTTGDSVEVLRRDANSFLVLGNVRTTQATTVEVSNSLALAWTVQPAYSDGASSGSKIVSATDTQSYRSSDKWERDDVYQGAYSSSVSLGYFRGCYFYGSTAFASLNGKRCTRLRIRVSRKGSGGIAGAEGVYIAPHAHGSRPSGSPLWRASARNVGSLAWGANGTFDLPVSWGQGLIDGTIKGFGHLRDSSSDYAIFDSLASDSASGRLTLDWTD